MKDKSTLIFGLALILASPLMAFYILTLPDIPCSKLPIDQRADCLKQTPQEYEKSNLVGRQGAAIIIPLFMWPYGVYYLYKRNKEIKKTNTQESQS